MSGRVIPTQSALGMMLLLMSGALFAVDVAAMRELRAQDAARIGANANDPARSVQRATSTQTAALPLRCPTLSVASVPKVTRSTDAGGRRDATRVSNSVSTGHQKTKSDTKVLVARTLAPTRHVSRVAEAHIVHHHHDDSAQALHVVAIAPPVLFAPTRPALHVRHKVAAKSTLERAQYAVVQLVKAETRGVRSLSAVTTKAGRDRLIVRVITRTRSGTFVESDVLRRNGYGFAIESRKYRVIAAPRIAAAQTSRLDPGP